jgi:type IV pilus assembly protein PilP
MSQHKLSDLEYVGYVKDTDGGNVYAIVEAPDGLTQRMRRGEYMGSDSGQITEITEQYIQLQEVVHLCVDGEARWVEATNYLAIQGAVNPVPLTAHPNRVPYRGAQKRCP